MQSLVTVLAFAASYVGWAFLVLVACLALGVPIEPSVRSVAAAVFLHGSLLGTLTFAAWFAQQLHAVPDKRASLRHLEVVSEAMGRAQQRGEMSEEMLRLYREARAEAIGKEAEAYLRNKEAQR